ncbi:MAG TPA: CAP domain-containing protein [Jatrophihabitans sp.]
MPAVQPPALWLSIAATAVSVVTVAAMASSGGPRRPLTFAGAVLLPGDQRSVTSPAASDTTRPSRQLSLPSPARTRTRTSAAPSAADSTAGYASSAPVIVPIHNASSTPAPAAGPSSPAGAPAAPAARPTAQPHAPRTTAPDPPDTRSSEAALAAALFSALNQARRQIGLPALSWSDRLQRSAADHNHQMAEADELASRVGDEPALGVRQANQGVLGDYAAENVASTQALSLAGALAAQQSMLAEPPLDGARRQNLLSPALNAVGIDVLLDPAQGRMWITQDFAQLP